MYNMSGVSEPASLAYMNSEIEMTYLFDTILCCFTYDFLETWFLREIFLLELFECSGTIKQKLWAKYVRGIALVERKCMTPVDDTA